MKDLTTKEFCREFSACKEGAKFSRKYKTMRECYAALLRGEAGKNSYEWALWVATRTGVMPKCDLRLFAVRCARRVQHLLTYESATRALDVAERYANGGASRKELAAAHAAAYAAGEAAAWAAAAMTRAARPVVSAEAAYTVAREAQEAQAAYIGAREGVNEEQAAQFIILAEFGNPFEEAKNE